MIYFRFPFAEEILTVNENSSQKIVSFFPFDDFDPVHFEGKLEEIVMEDFKNLAISTNSIHSNTAEFQPENQIQYQNKLEKVINFVKDNELSKLVISRRKVVDLQNSSINISQTFLNLIETYPNAFIYFFIKEDKSWIGAFSEILGKFNKNTSEFETMSLAGTIPVSENWGNKEIEEQKPVTEFIRNILKNYSSEITKSETYDHISGNIKHLRTDFKINIEKSKVEDLILELHPTPAVCGIPTDFCKNAIQNFEADPRKLYAGYIRVETEEFVQYFVNLRCAELFSNTAIIYVGGGITAESSPEKEWQETELKAEAILNNLSFLSKN